MARKKYARNSDLSLASFDDIIAELHKRYDVFIFSGLQIRKKDEIFTIRKWGGNTATCAGLASQIQIAIYDTQCKEASEKEQDHDILFEP